MTTAKSAARTIAVLIIGQLVGGPLVNFGLLAPVFAAPGFLVNAAAHSMQIGLAVVIALVIGAFSVGIAIAAWPVLRQHSEAMALWLFALAVVTLSLTAVENASVLSMLSLSQAYAAAGADRSDLFETLRGLVASARNWAHYINLIGQGTVLIVFYGALYRFALVPRALAAFGFAATLLQIGTVAMPLFGYRIVFSLLAPLGLAQIALVIWLLTKGFDERRAHGVAAKIAANEPSPRGV